MAVRRQRSANTTNSVTKFYGKYNIMIEPDTYVNKSRIYSKFKSIEKGTAKLPVPMRRLGHNVLIFMLNENGELRFYASWKS